MEKQSIWIEKYSEVNRALELVKNIDFQVYVERLRADNFRQIQFMFGKEVINSLPDIETIFATREEVTRNLEDHFQKKLNSWPDKELCRKEFLGMVVSNLLRNETSIYKIRTGDLAFLNFQFIGEVWSYSEILKKYLEKKPVSSSVSKPPPTLEEIFKDRENLKKLVELLKEKGFVNSAGHWTGIPTELAALSKVCQFLIKNGIENVKVYKAWRDFFNKGFTDTVFKKTIKEDHLKKFDFIKTEFEKQ